MVGVQECLFTLVLEKKTCVFTKPHNLFVMNSPNSKMSGKGYNRSELEPNAGCMGCVDTFW